MGLYPERYGTQKFSVQYKYETNLIMLLYRSALKKRSEAFHLCEALDPVQCIKRLYSKQHVSRSTVKDVERSAEKGRHTASTQCLSHVLQMSDAGLSYFVDKYLRAQHLDLLAETLVTCPGDGVCELDSADHHRTMSTSTTELEVPTKATSAAGVGEGPVKEVSKHRAVITLLQFGFGCCCHCHR